MSKDARYNKLIQSKRWLELRHRKISANPLCEVCERSGIYTSAQAVHHITPVESATTVSEMQRLMYNYNNLMSVCYQCHAAIHRELRSNSRKVIAERREAANRRFKDKFL